MAQTEHLGLHQWEASDSFLRTDFNEDFAKLDAAVGGLITVGTYTGNAPYGNQTLKQEITLGFSPSITIISGEVYTTADDPGMQHTVIATSSSPNMVYDTTATGFSVHKVGDYKPRLNVDGQRYRYIAFR